MEIQVNGGSVADKVEYVQGLFEKSMEVGTDFEQDECDVIAVTKGHGLEGVTHRWCALQPRLTHENGPLTRIMTGTSPQSRALDSGGTVVDAPAYFCGHAAAVGCEAFAGLQGGDEGVSGTYHQCILLLPSLGKTRRSMACLSFSGTMGRPIDTDSIQTTRHRHQHTQRREKERGKRTCEPVPGLAVIAIAHDALGDLLQRETEEAAAVAVAPRETGVVEEGVEGLDVGGDEGGGREDGDVGSCGGGTDELSFAGEGVEAVRGVLRAGEGGRRRRRGRRGRRRAR
jgi:Ribosomal protein L3